MRDTAISFEDVPPSDDEIRARIAAVHPQRPWLVAEDDGAFLGYAYDVLGYRRAFVGITLPNAASVGLHHALGFTEVGILQRAGFKFGRYHDVASLERSLGTDPQPPDGEPRSFASLSPAFVADVLAAHAGPST